MKQTKTRRILEYIRDNEPCKAKDICINTCESRTSTYSMDPNSKPRRYYTGWSGIRNYLTSGTKWYRYSNEPSIELTKEGYVLTKYGRKRLE